jgi:hypothetical protein
MDKAATEAIRIQAIVIKNEEERKSAIERARELTGCTRGSEEERELQALIDAIAEYDIANAVPRGVGGRHPTE